MVQVIPKAPQKQVSIIKKILPWLSFILLAIVIGLYFIFSYQASKTETALDQAKQQLVQVQEDEQEELEREILTFKMKTEDVAQLLQAREKTTDFFGLLEALVHPELYFISLSFDMGDKRAIIEGITDDFTSLGEQIIAFNQSPSVEQAELSDIVFTKEGKIEFSITILLSRTE